jgi:hypothetical protein
LFREAIFQEDLADFLGVLGLNTLGGKDEVDQRSISLGTIDIVFDVDSLELRTRREAFDLFVGNGTHKSRLTTTIGTTETITTTTLETKGSTVKQDLSTISKRELTVTEIFTFIIFFLRILGSNGFLTLVQGRESKSLGILSGVEGLGIGSKSLDPDILEEVLGNTESKSNIV